MDQSNIEPDERVDSPNNKECQIDTEVFGASQGNGDDTIFFQDSKPQVNGDESTDNDNTEPIPTDSNSLVRLVFRDGSTFDECHKIIGKCVRDALFEMKKAISLVVNRAENSINIYEILESENDENQFMVDTLPTECTNETEIPDYNSSAIDTLNNVNDDDANDDNANDDSKPRGAGNCWNCGGDHTIKDCKEKRDPVAISARKQMFAQKTKVERYHLEAEQKYSHLVPGRISKNLREALGLRTKELPLYIYKMRLYGYPEGWLKEAKIDHSGLTMFSEKRSSTDINNENEGEVDKSTYDASKFIEYPGFNAAVPSNLIDEGDYYRVPPMEFYNSKEGLIQLLQNSLANPYKRRKRFKLDASGQPSSTPPQGDDMELQNSDEEPTDQPVLFASSKPNSSDSDLDESNSNQLPEDASSESIKLSLLELKRKQEEILRALQDESEDSNSNPNSNSAPLDRNESPNDDDTNEIDEKVPDETASNVTIQNDEPNENLGNAEINAMDTICTEKIEVSENPANQLENVSNTPSSPSVAGQSRLAMCGTPLIKQVSPFSRLPTGEKWSVGVTEVIDFENLPDATGTYSKLSGVIEKVRSVIKRINDDEHDAS